MSFNHLKKLEVTNELTVRYPLLMLEGEPFLMLAPATSANKKYFNALLRRNRKNMRQIQTQSFNMGFLDENRKSDRKLYPEFVIRGWGKVKDDENKPVKFTLDNVRAYVQALPDWIFDEVRVFCTSIRNFVDIDEEATAGNLQSD